MPKTPLAAMVLLLLTLAPLGLVHADGWSVTVAQGRLDGVAGLIATRYLGIPYAASPAGDRRWRAPDAAPAWSGVRTADRHGLACPQNTGSPTALSELGPLGEDCLNLNVITPSVRPAALVPVMVWFHGGGFFTGSGSEAPFDTDEYARRGIILVTANYRLGRLGFFAHPALRDAAGGNYGIQDAVAALRWVRQNIATFGGDPENVTVFGESAGGAIVNALLVSPTARGLFHKAIIESGALLNPLRSLAEAEVAGAAFAAALGLSGEREAASALRALSLDALVPRKITSSDFIASVSPVLDGVVLPKSPADAIAAGDQARIPVLIGSNTMEGSVWSWDQPGKNPGTVPIRPQSSDQILAALGPDRAALLANYAEEGDSGRRAQLVGSDLFMGSASRREAQLLARTGAPVWLYRFDAVPQPLRASVPGAPHGTEIFYVFGTLGKMRTATPPSDGDLALSAAIIDYWAAFARTGRPQPEGRPGWPQFEPGNDMIMTFANDGPKPGRDPRARALQWMIDQR